ncbi:MAG: hypothetical protein KF699_06785 [Phycisphaeraceae bacterium]|nr:hypothetical protein [Phycisphaeraceae bacterium]MBX3407252.1 hypothetical protein [Phycisphaeraceae bacterium]
MPEITENSAQKVDAMPSALNQTATRLSRNWLLKQGAFLIVLLVFGVWGLADALHFYPRRGLEEASARLRDHLQAAAAAGKLTPADLKIDEPSSALAVLRPRAEELQSASLGSAADRATIDARFLNTRREWLESLARAWRLGPEPQVVVWPGQSAAELPDAATRSVLFDHVRGVGLVVSAKGAQPQEIPPQRLLAELAQVWSTRNAPKPLSSYDMFFQWFFVVAGFGGGGWLATVLLRAASRTYRWNPTTQTLSLPGGASFTPADLKEVDKRRWHKFFVTLHLRNGAAHTLDLLRYVPLEEWVLAMERTAFPEPAQPAPAAGGDAGDPGGGDGGD